MNLWTKFLDYMRLSEEDEVLVAMEPEIVEEHEEEHEEEDEEEQQKSLIRKRVEQIQERIDKRFNEMVNDFFEKTAGFWEALGKSTEKTSEVFDKLHEKMGTFLMLVLVGTGAISLYVLVVILSFNL